MDAREQLTLYDLLTPRLGQEAEREIVLALSPVQDRILRRRDLEPRIDAVLARVESRLTWRMIANTTEHPEVYVDSLDGRA